MRGAHSRRWLLAWTVLLGGPALAVLLAGFRVPLGYDEAYNLQVSVHLAESGRYMTDGSVHSSTERGVFDHYISTGPTVLAPAAGALALLGEQVWVARLVPSAYFVAFLALGFVAGRRVAGPWGGAAAVLGALTLDLSTDGDLGFRGSGDVLGEVPAAVFVLAAALLLRRSVWGAGFLLGLAVLSKLLMLLALPAFLVAVLLADGTRRDRVGRVVSLIIGAALPSLVWTALQIAVLGPEAWGDRTDRFLRFFVFGGSGLVPDPQYQASRLDVLVSSWSWPALALITASATLMLFAAALRTGALQRRWLASSVASRQLVVAVAGTGLLVVAWWTLLAGRVLGRYLVTPLLLLSVIAAALACVAVRELMDENAAWARPLAVVALSGAAGLALGHAVTAFSPPGADLEQQRRVAVEVQQQTGSDERVAGIDWFQNPEIRFLSGVPSRQLAHAGDLLVLSPDFLTMEPQAYAQALASCVDVLLREGDYVVCRAEP